MLKQNLQLKLQQKLSPQQIQLMKLLQVSTMDLEQRIKEELQDNPALEEGDEEIERDDQDELDQDENIENENDDIEINLEDYFDEDTPDYKTQVNNQGKDIEERQTPIGQGSSFQDLLYQQLHFLELNEEEMMIADYLIGNLDDDGYLRRDLASIGNDLLFAQGITTEIQQLENALQQIQSLDPPGIGARNLQECLSIQIKRAEKKDNANATARIIVSKYFEEFTKKHFEKIATRLNQTLDDIKPAIDLILHLNPKPGNAGSDSNKEVPHITQDFLLSIDNEELKLSLNGKNAP
jgi:RNA polymerase sigma-54 factor